MRVSPTGLHLTSHFEGWRSKAYRDSGGKWTIGRGHLIRPNESYLLTATLTLDEGDLLLRNDMRLAEDCVNANCPFLEQYQFDAITDFTFNCGCRNLRNSTLLSRLKRGDKRASDELLIWNRDATGKVRRGLIRRRATEWLMFQGREVDLT